MLPREASTLSVVFTNVRAVHDKGQYTVYTVLVKDTGSGLNWMLTKRYKEFRSLHHAMEDMYPNITTPKFPPTKWFGNMRPDFVARRKDKLEHYLGEVLQHPVLNKCDALHYFLADFKNCAQYREDMFKLRNQVDDLIMRNDELMNKINLLEQAQDAGGAAAVLDAQKREFAKSSQAFENVIIEQKREIERLNTALARSKEKLADAEGAVGSRSKEIGVLLRRIQGLEDALAAKDDIIHQKEEEVQKNSNITALIHSLAGSTVASPLGPSTSSLPNAFQGIQSTSSSVQCSPQLSPRSSSPRRKLSALSAQIQEHQQLDNSDEKLGSRTQSTNTQATSSFEPIITSHTLRTNSFM